MLHGLPRWPGFSSEYDTVRLEPVSMTNLSSLRRLRF